MSNSTRLGMWVCSDLRSAIRRRQTAVAGNGARVGLLVLALAAGAVIYWDLSRRGWASVVD